ncbi:MAG: MbcA/ParS/Xre antitoxin family protein [Alphaproteobacteria bacterium]|nr:MbcA/ParS/Xre antitoxin family protein [Alphaproteobacteria bacterium]MDP3532485.1 MbcA/ParS/Xre antitoxin family protein [Alphaproteobacteria bacterium]
MVNANQNLGDLPQDLVGPALRGFFNITHLWALTTLEERKILGDPPRSTFFQWKKNKNGHLTRDTLERISYILGIYKALQILLPDPILSDQWIKRPNFAQPFNGQSALERMLSGNVADLYLVRKYLDAQRG